MQGYSIILTNKPVLSTFLPSGAYYETELYNICKKAHTIKVILHDKTVIEGTVYGFTWAVNNEPEIADIDIKLANGQLAGAFLDEIESIEIIES